MQHKDVKIKVWIDQDLCTGDGLSEEICPSVFGMNPNDGLAYVKEAEWKTINGPTGSSGDEPVYKMADGLATVPGEDVQAAIEAAEECPGECIFIEVMD